MPLTPEQEKALREQAEQAGINPEQAVQAANAKLDGKADSAGKGSSSADAPREDGRPVADRLLIGFLPFIKVKELRSIWLGLTDSIPDDDMTCGDYSLKHGGAPAKAEPEPE